jgi:hypothetical protein
MPPETIPEEPNNEPAPGVVVTSDPKKKFPVV